VLRRAGAVLLPVLLLALAACACSASPTAAPAAAPPTAPAGVGPAADAPPTPATLRKVTIGIPEFSADYLAYVAGQQRGVYAAAGIDLEVNRTRTDLAVAAVSSDQLDYGAPLSVFLRAAAEGAPIKLVMAMADSASYYLTGQPGMRGPADLRGKSIGITSRGGNLHTAALAALLGNGMSADDVTFVSFPGANEMYVALTQSAIDAAVLPLTSKILADRDGFPLVVDTGPYYDGGIRGLATSDRKLQENPGDVEQMIRATLRAMAWVRENRADAIQVLQEMLNEDPTTTAIYYEHVVADYSATGEVKGEWVQKQLQEMELWGRPARITDEAQLVDRRPWRAATAR
jgi:NitT/TauT family transport system substrate-binding protein